MSEQNTKRPGNDLFYEGLGWMQAECIAIIDRGEDIKQVLVPDLVEKAENDLNVDREAYNKICASPEMAQELESLRAEVERLREGYCEIREIYAGMEGFIPETAAEGYLQQTVNKMWKATNAMLSTQEQETGDEIRLEDMQ